jgi:phage internal scaffolding protein
MVAPFVRSPYNYDMSVVSDETGVDCFALGGPSMTQQHFRDECDINTIVRRFGLTGELPSGLQAPVYADFEGVMDYHTALNAVLDADSAFMELPAHVRARFANDAGAFVDFCSDDRNRAEAEKLGLVFPKAEPPAAPQPSAGTVST